MKKTLTFIVLLTFVVLVSCKNDATTTETEDQQKTEMTDSTVSNENAEPKVSTETADTASVEKAHTSKYICPNHCKNSGSDKAGECPECGMEYIENFDYNNESI